MTTDGFHWSLRIAQKEKMIPHMYLAAHSPYLGVSPPTLIHRHLLRVLPFTQTVRLEISYVNLSLLILALQTQNHSEK